ncbi:PAS domain-containing protein [Dyadobacter subterraneus]|uniref:histidine kinase n=1 Tax=Dyadobacter subterraneus TaxID=2773304 RepID=A0ABR9WFB9_9BACT|nr:PAS domain-containing protein [Dyadobacter subterraneus]MBE9464183.1 PAS domain-containing protein [Dyadobacter subterraneus]
MLYLGLPLKKTGMLNMVDPKYLNKVFNAFPAPGVVLLPDSPKFTVIEVNQAYLDITNIAREDFIGKGFFGALSRNSYFKAHLWKDLLERSIREKLPMQTPVFDYEIPVKGTSDFVIKQLVTSITPVLGDDNEIEFIIRSVTDVTEMLAVKENEKAVIDNLARNEKFLEETQRLARIGSWEADLVNRKINWSDVVREIHEVAKDYIPYEDAPVYFFKEGENRNLFQAAVNKALENGLGFDLELQIITAKGNERWIRLTGDADFNDGICTRIYGSIQDINDRKINEQELLDSRNRLESLIHTVDGIVWEADAQTFEFSFISDQVINILGYTPREWLAEPDFWANHIHPFDRVQAVAYCRRWVKDGRNHTFDYRMIRADGSMVWIKDVVSVIREDGKPTLLRGIMMDISDGKRFTELESLEKKILELNSHKEIAIKDILTEYLKGIEAIFPHMKCSILQAKNGRLYNWASPSLPPEYVEAIQGFVIGNNFGSCGSAAFLKKPVIVSDVTKDLRWADYKDLALKYGLRACWSHPILNAEGKVIATLGIYYHEVKEPVEEELKVIEKSNAILKVILENRQSSEMLEETFFLMNQGQELAHFGNWQWDIVNNIVSWSDTLYDIYGLNRAGFRATFEAYQELLHPDDKTRVYHLIQSVLQTKKDIVFEERIIRPSGEIRHLKSWGRLKTDEKGKPLKMIGACLDITESRKVQEELLASESRLRSLVDAQTNYVVRLDLAGRYTYYNKKYKQDFGWFFPDQNLIGHDCLEITIPEHHARLLEVCELCKEKPGKVYQIEIDKIPNGNGIISTLWDFVCLIDSNGRPSEIQCTGLDVTDRKKMEDALKNSNERYELVNRATNDAIYDWDLTTDHIAWGDGYRRLFGYEVTDERYPVEKWSSNVHPDDIEAVTHNLNKALADKTQQNWASEYRYRTLAGTYAFAQERGFIVRNSNAEPVRMIGVLQDITERKQTQIKLLRKSKFLAAIAEVNNSLLQYSDWSEALDKSFGIVGLAIIVDRVYYFENYTDGISGQKFASQKFEWNAGTFDSQVDNPLLQNVPHEKLASFINLLNDNKPFTAIVSQLPESDLKIDLIEQDVKSLMIVPVFVKNKFHGYVGFDDCRLERLWDEDEISFLKTIAVNLAKVIEGQEADKALFDAFEEKNKTLESIQDGFFAVNEDWIVTYWNKEAENLLNIKREEIVNHNFWDIYNKSISSRFYYQYNKALKENTPVRFEEHFTPLDRWFEVSAFPAKAGLTVYFKNITERKFAEEKLKELHQELESNLKVLAISNAELEQFAYVASHDLQEPLRMVTSFLTLLEKKYSNALDEKAKRYIFFAVDGAKRMRQIILDLLDFSRVGKSEEKLEEVDLNELLEEIILLYRKNIEEKQAVIRFSDLPALVTFKTPLRQIFQNLISNGLKYQPDNRIPEIDISSKETGSHWEFAVQDNGIGIDEQYFDKIFIIFQRLHNKDEYSGTGMGLAITKKIVENLGGKIWLKSVEGKESTFYFSIAKQQPTTL